MTHVHHPRHQRTPPVAALLTPPETPANATRTRDGDQQPEPERMAEDEVDYPLSPFGEDMTALLPAFVGTPERNKVWHTDAMSLLKAQPSNSVDMVFIDPPYGNSNGVDDLAASRARDKVRGGRQAGEITPIANDDPEAWAVLMQAVLPEINRVLKPEASCCCCIGGGGPGVQYAKLSLWIDQYLDFFQAVVWDKSARGNGMGWRYRRNYEFVLVSHKRGGKLAWNDSRPARPNVVRFAPVPNEHHPTEKPLNLVEEFILNHTNEGDLVMDCFAGSGTTLLAAANLEREFIGCDVSMEYVNMARKRLMLRTVPMFVA